MASDRFFAFWISSAVTPSFWIFSTSDQISFSRSSGWIFLSRRGVAVNWKAPTYHCALLDAETVTAISLSVTSSL